ncbi:hypothetical protein [Pseudomonas mangiferae]|uniref:Uncharacterized protein n=1 Tax=Pseudomonas mangiferae TaxID=2593654 RepID=A0A553GUP6_9PSED|nr:hypothetical protein [Pseudomonas mangiferae]TRX73238.1 hypothetical protein FM069_18875 [Pseudomonas mangiferae]
MLRILLRHAKAITGTASLVGAGLGLVFLRVYLGAIGRPELFMDSLDVGPALFAWLGASALVGVATLAALAMPSIVLGIFVSALRLPEAVRATVMKRALVTVAVGFASLFGCLLWITTEMARLALPVVLISVGTTLVMFRRWDRGFQTAWASTLAAQANPDAHGTRYGMLAIAIVLLAFAALAGVYPVSLALEAYRGGDGEWAQWKGLLVGFLSMLLTLLPAATFYLNEGAILRRFQNLALGTAIMAIPMLFMSTAIVQIVVYGAAGLVQVRQQAVLTLALDARYPPAAFQGGAWHGQPLGDGRVRIEAFRLYSFGGLHLLCPARWVDTRLENWPSRASACVPVHTDDYVVLPPTSRVSPPATEGEGPVGCVSARPFAQPPRLRPDGRVCLFAQPL